MAKSKFIVRKKTTTALQREVKSLRLPADLAQQIDRWAKAMGEDSHSEAMRHLLEIGLSVADRSALPEEPLNAREIDILHLLERGLSNKQIARRLARALGLEVQVDPLLMEINARLSQSVALAHRAGVELAHLHLRCASAISSPLRECLCRHPAWRDCSFLQPIHRRRGAHTAIADGRARSRRRQRSTLRRLAASPRQTNPSPAQY